MRRTYYLDPEEVGIDKRIGRAMFALAIFVGATYVFHVIWTRNEKRGIWDYGVDAVIVVATDLFVSRGRPYEIEVSDDEIQMRRDGSLLKRVRKGRIRRVYEVAGNLFREPALRICESGPLGTFFRGCVVVPARMPEYEQVRALATSWIAIG